MVKLPAACYPRRMPGNSYVVGWVTALGNGWIATASPTVTPTPLQGKKFFEKQNDAKQVVQSLARMPLQWRQTNNKHEPIRLEGFYTD